jgi:hypothetical protein
LNFGVLVFPQGEELDFADPWETIAMRKQVAAASVSPCATALAQDLATSVVGSWRLASQTVTAAGAAFDSHAALLQQRQCAATMRFHVGADGTYRLDASASDCDEKYKSTQQKPYAKTKWKLGGNEITTSATNFAVGQTYTASVAGNRVPWVVHSVGASPLLVKSRPQSSSVLPAENARRSCAESLSNPGSADHDSQPGAQRGSIGSPDTAR